MNGYKQHCADAEVTTLAFKNFYHSYSKNHSLSSIFSKLALGSLTAIACSSVVVHDSFVIRESTVPILPPGCPDLKLLHISDIHMLPFQVRKQNFIHDLINLNPDFVVNTGDNLAHPQSVRYVVQALGDLLSVPGAFVFGSNDYFAPRMKNPFSYLKKSRHASLTPSSGHVHELPWRDLRAAFTERGWLDATNKKYATSVAGLHLEIAGVDDPHIERDDYSAIAGLSDFTASLSIGLSHSPEPVILDKFAEDKYDLVLSGHTHGGQVCLPGFGAIVTNSGLDRKYAKGWSSWKNTGMHLHVSAGLGTSPFFPFRTFCRPEVSLLTLVSSPEPHEPTDHQAQDMDSVPGTT